MLSQVLFQKFTITFTNFATDFTLERLDDEFVSVKVNESCVSNTPRLVFWLGNKFNSFILKTSIGMACQEISRYITQGRNFHCSIIGVSQRLASVDTNFVENCDLRYIGRTSGDNNRRKMKGFGISKEDITTIQNLPRGKFLMHYGTSTSIEEVPYFKSPIKPQRYVEPQKPEKPTLVQRIIKAVIGA